MQSIRRVIADRTGHLIVVGTHVNGFEWLLDRYNDTGERTHVRGGEQLLPPLALGLSGDAAVDSRGAVYWQFIPLLGGTPLNYLAKLRAFELKTLRRATAASVDIPVPHIHPHGVGRFAVLPESGEMA